MNDVRDAERKPLVRICWVMVGVIAVFLGVIAWQLLQKTGAEEADVAPQVVDQTPPVFEEYLVTVELTTGTAFDFLSFARAVDETDAEVEIRLDGSYDAGVEGEYNLEYVARDQSGNQAKQPLLVRVVAGEAGSARILDRVFKTEKGFQAETKDGVTYVDGVLIANKTYGLPENYGEALTEEVVAAFEEMEAAAGVEGLNLWIVSGFRSYLTQQNLYNRYAARDGVLEAETYSARPGFSEHQTGLAMDINMADSSFANTAEGQWLAQHCYEYGFILRYPEGKSEITGYVFEPWHFRYVGRDLAEKLYNAGDWLSMEEYFGLTSKYDK